MHRLSRTLRNINIITLVCFRSPLFTKMYFRWFTHHLLKANVPCTPQYLISTPLAGNYTNRLYTIPSSGPVPVKIFRVVMAVMMICYSSACPTKTLFDSIPAVLFYLDSNAGIYSVRVGSRTEKRSLQASAKSYSIRLTS